VTSPPNFFRMSVRFPPDPFKASRPRPCSVGRGRTLNQTAHLEMITRLFIRFLILSVVMLSPTTLAQGSCQCTCCGTSSAQCSPKLAGSFEADCAQDSQCTKEACQAAFPKECFEEPYAEVRKGKKRLFVCWKCQHIDQNLCRIHQTAKGTNHAKQRVRNRVHWLARVIALARDRRASQIFLDRNLRLTWRRVTLAQRTHAQSCIQTRAWSRLSHPSFQ